jgi:hypothetical protein
MKFQVGKCQVPREEVPREEVPREEVPSANGRRWNAYAAVAVVGRKKERFMG